MNAYLGYIVVLEMGDQSALAMHIFLNPKLQSMLCSLSLILWWIFHINQIEAHFINFNCEGNLCHGHNISHVKILSGLIITCNTYDINSWNVLKKLMKLYKLLCKACVNTWVSVNCGMV